MYNVHPKWSRKIDLDFCAEFVLSWQACDQPAVVMMWLLDLERRATLVLPISCLLILLFLLPTPLRLPPRRPPLQRWNHFNISNTLPGKLESFSLNSWFSKRYICVSKLKIGRMAWQSCIYSISSFLRIQLKLNTALLSTVRPCVRPSQAWHLTFLTYVKA